MAAEQGLKRGGSWIAGELNKTDELYQARYVLYNKDMDNAWSGVNLWLNICKWKNIRQQHSFGKEHYLLHFKITVLSSLDTCDACDYDFAAVVVVFCFVIVVF